MGILISVLEAKGFTVIHDGSLYRIVRSADAAKNNVKVERRGKKLDGQLMVTQSIKVRGENVDIVASKIRYLVSKTAKLMTIKESNILLITDYPKNIETIKKVIRDIDTNNKAIVKIVYVKNTEAKKLQARLSDISKSIFNSKVASQKVKILVDNNINGIIIVGNKKNVRKIESLVVRLDVESKINREVSVFLLKNSEAKVVLATLNEIITKQKFSDPALKPTITASEEINSIIAVGDPYIIKGIKLIIDEIDKEKFQVYVQARIININKKNAENLGIKYGFSAGDVSTAGIYSMSANFGSGALTSIAANSVIASMTGEDKVATAFSLGATLDFLEINGAAESVSNPSILCVNNKESSIYVGKTISIASGTTSVAGSTTSSFKREDVGLTLKIKPRVSSKDKVTLDVEAILENVTDSGLSGGVSVRQPETSKQEIKTQAILRHGESIIIGGLVKSYSQEGVSKIPYLSAIPLIGKALFTSRSKKTAQDNLVVILTPYVIGKSEELSKLQKNLGVLATLQEEYNAKVFSDLKQKAIETKLNGQYNHNIFTNNAIETN
jgi:general secretion pathway protein D